MYAVEKVRAHHEDRIDPDPHEVGSVMLYMQDPAYDVACCDKNTHPELPSHDERLGDQNRRKDRITYQERKM